MRAVEGARPYKSTILHIQPYYILQNPNCPAWGKPQAHTAAEKPSHIRASIPLPASGTSGTTFPTELHINHRTHMLPPHPYASAAPMCPGGLPPAWQLNLAYM